MSCCVNINWNCLSPSKKNVDYIKEFVDSINQTLQDWNKALSDYNVKVDTLYKILNNTGNIDIAKVQTQLDSLESLVNTFIESQYIKLGEAGFFAYNLCLGSKELVSPVNVPLQPDRYGLVVTDFKENGKLYKTINLFNGAKNMYLSGTGEFVTLPTIPDITAIRNGVVTNAKNITTLQGLWNNYWQEIKNDDGTLYGIKPARQLFLKDTPKLGIEDLSTSDTYYMPLIQKRNVGSTEYVIQGLSTPLQYTTDNTKKYFSKAGTWEDIPKGGGTGSIENVIVETTYQELKNLKSLSSLVPGVFYTITDYQTIVFSDNASSLGKPCPLTVQAVTTDILSEQATLKVDNKLYYCKYCFDNDTGRFVFVNPYANTIIKSAEGDFFIRNTEMPNSPIWWKLSGVTSIQDIIDNDGNNLIPDNSAWIKTYIDYDQTTYLHNVPSPHAPYMYHTPVGYKYTGTDNGIKESKGCNATRIVDIYPTSKGVIYEMTDQSGNKFPYDFIHTIFWNAVDEDTIIEGYTFSVNEGLEAYEYEEASHANSIYNNTLKPIYKWNSYANAYIQVLNNIIYYFKDQSGDGSFYCINGNFGSIYNTVFENCYIQDITFTGGGDHNYFNGVDITSTTFGKGFQNNSIYGENITNTTFGDTVFNNNFYGEIYGSYIGNDVRNSTFTDLYTCNIEGNNDAINAYWIVDTDNKKRMIVRLTNCIVKFNTSNITLGIKTSDTTYDGTAHKYILDSSISDTLNTIYLSDGESNKSARIIKNTDNIEEIQVTTLTQ